MAEYYFLVSSLPMLMADIDPAMGLEEFETQCADWLSEKELHTLAHTSLVPDRQVPSSSVTAQWNDWETSLRNRIARSRAHETEGILRDEYDSYGELEQGLNEVLSQSDPMEKERLLDAMRWRFLDNLESAHFFDFGALCVYKLKLMLRLKWVGRAVNPGRENLDKIVDHVGNRDVLLEEGVDEKQI